ncbi:MAG: four helix bundle protein [Bacteroidia bacterium]|nr:four helix bundle protein [Bacteroidia bacterium]
MPMKLSCWPIISQRLILKMRITMRFGVWGMGDRVWGLGRVWGKIKIQIMAKINSFKELMVWQEAMNLVEMIYWVTKNYPKEEIYGLTSQTRRAGTSIPANIAEGYGRNNRKEYLHFLGIANGSLTELETHILIAQRIQILTQEETETLITQIQTVGRILTALRKSLTPNP